MVHREDNSDDQQIIDNYFAGYDGINPTLEFDVGCVKSASVSGVFRKSAVRHFKLDITFPTYCRRNTPLEGDLLHTPYALKHRYWWGPQVDQLFADVQVSDVSQAGEVLWPLPDHLGTIRDIAKFDGTSFEIVNHRTYDSFGNLTAQTDPNDSIAFGYTGKYFDPYSGLSHHWNHWYDPNLGKWISEDPIGFKGGDSNLYR